MRLLKAHFVRSQGFGRKAHALIKCTVNKILMLNLC